MRVVLFSRRPRPGRNYSIESIVDGLRQALDPALNPTLVVSRFESSGVFRRIYNVLEAATRQGDINHVTGDVHFLTFLLDPARTILTVHDCGRIAGELTLRKRLIRALWFRLPVQHCSAVTVVSETVKQELLSHVNVAPGKVHVIPSFVPQQFSYQPRVFDSECPVLLHVGTSANKNLLRVCEALDGIKCKLRVVGPLNEDQRSKLAAHRIDYENFQGISTESMVELYASSDVVLFASTFEGFGMPIIEGNLVGRPVVTSTVASMPEVAKDAACLVDPFDVASIREGVNRVLTDAAYRAVLVENGFQNGKRFALPRIARQYEQLYRAVAEQKGTAS